MKDDALMFTSEQKHWRLASFQNSLRVKAPLYLSLYFLLFIQQTISLCLCPCLPLPPLIVLRHIFFAVDVTQGWSVK